MSELKKERLQFKDLHKLILNIPRSKEMATNFCGQKELQKQTFEVLYTDLTVVFWYWDAFVCRVFFYSVKDSEVRKLLQMTPENAVMDIISPQKEEQKRWEKLTGFSSYAVYGRFGRKIAGTEEEKKRFKREPLDRFYKEEYGIPAVREQLEEIQQVLEDHFDAGADHLYSKQEMAELIDKKRVWIHSEEGRITTIFVYRIEGKKFYSNISLNDSTADVLYSIQKKVLLNAIEEFKVLYYYGWIRINNRQALRKNHYPEFDVYDYVMVQKGE